uniref:GPI ethanolamine phosphate transferase 1 n=1 Tax=Panagrolaimus sp. JU765 TaxID=591449 RepID=A0AC34QAF1_9BILA
MHRYLFILGVVVHLVLFYSIFDIYYKSPLVKGTTPQPITNGVAPAKRVFIFSADGLRSSAFFANPDKSPFLHRIIRDGLGVWGISKSHVPTESRPGHVAMLAGFYEDVSAVTLGWKHNPVTFDSVFNQSRFSYMWGSPDILPMFSHELNHSRSEMYTHEEEDFASSDAANLDRWVFERVETLFKRFENDEKLKQNLKLDRQIFFLHLLGVWGISKSHVPTESRPGHVAMLAGFYEDVSAVTLGWKHNPVTFDSVFNQSRFSYMWGSPDILPMFSHELNHSRSEMYTHEEEDFASSDAANLDRWVFERVETLFKRSENDEKLKQNLELDRQIFFLHLLGLDTNGHGFKPNSDKYLDNIRIVDEGIKNMSKLVDDYFGDKETAFLFTSDHGMTDWGSHGSGTDDEILTPFVAWGAGIHKKRGKSVINQVDVAPFISALLGIAVPMNSVGVLPLEFLDGQPQYKFQASCANLKQMVVQYNIRRTERETNSLPYLFRDFPGFKLSVLDKVQEQIYELKAQRRLDQAARFCNEWVPRVRDALIYFHRYQRFSLGTAVAFLFLTWNFTLYAVFSRSSKSPPIESATFVPNKAWTVLLAVSSLLIFYQRLAITNYLYYLLPVYLSSFCWNIGYLPDLSVSALIQKLTILKREDFQNFAVLTVYPIFIFVFALTIFVSAFFQRSVLSLMLIFIAFLPFIHGNRIFPWNYLWTASCLTLAIFPQLETVGKTPIPFLVILAPFLAVTLVAFINRIKPSNNLVFNNLPFILASAGTVILISNFCHSAPFLVKLASWSSLPSAFLLPLLASQNLAERLVCWLAALFLPYSLLTLAYESIFVLVFSVLLFTYVRLEYSHISDDQFFQLEVKSVVSNLDLDVHGSFAPKEWQRAFILITLTLLAFFGTGNIASLNSFNPTFLRNFITIFSPFTMATLLVLKIAIPFLLTALAYAAILHSERRTFIRLSILLMIITDSMAMAFFFFLKDEGSWLEIGISISNYVISMVSSTIVFFLLHLANWLLPLTLEELAQKWKKKSDLDA